MVQVKPSVLALPRSSTLAINERCAALAGEGKKVYRLGFGQSPFPVPSLVVDALRAHAPEKAYLPVEGLAALREAVAGYHCAYTGNRYNADQVLVGPGSKELLFILQFCFEAEVLIPSPSWVSYAPQARIAGRPLAWLPTHLTLGWRLSPETLDAHCTQGGPRARLLVLNYPNNPTGAACDGAALSALAEVARAHGVTIVSDEIYGALNFEGAHRSIAEFYPEGTLISNGISKWCGAGGWRLGTLVFPERLAPLREAMAVVASETYTSTSAPIQYAAVRAFEYGPEIQRYVHASRRILKSIASETRAKLRRHGVQVASAEGGFYLFPDFEPFRDVLARRGIETGEELCRQLLDEVGVALLPGKDFGRPPEELTARLAFVDFDGAEALAAALEYEDDGDLPSTFVAIYAPRVIEAIETLGRWLRA
jgi:aspartate aminotransferase